MSKTLRVRVGERWFTVEVGDLYASPVRALVDGEPVDVHIDSFAPGGLPDTLVETPEAHQARQPPPPPPPPDTTHDRTDQPRPTRSPAASAKTFTCPMPGVIVSVAVNVGDQVMTGDEICVLEAMKMNQSLRADFSGIVSAVYIQSGQQVLDGDPIVDLE